MDFIGINWADPLILLRVYLALIWGVTTVYGIRVLLIIPRVSSAWPLIGYSVVAGLLGALSYLSGAATVFHSVVGFLWVAVLLTFTPVALILWLNFAKAQSEIPRDNSS